jgi:NAD(P)-dependent dehydrogenase (short-subunit alcohol dehydrogenase family)
LTKSPKQIKERTNMNFENKIAVITGGNSGVGLATAHEFKQQRAQVVIIGDGGMAQA